MSKIHIQSLLHSYIAETTRKPIQKESISIKFTYLGISLTKDIQSADMQNYEILRDINEDLNKWTNILCSCLGRLNMVKI